MIEQTIQIKLSGPCQAWAGGQKEIILPLADGALLRDVLQRLVACYPEFKKLSLEDDSALRARAIFVQEGHILSLTQQVKAGVALQVLVPISGGGC